MDIISVVRRDCKDEHLKLDPQFVRHHFSGMPVQKISLEQMRAVYLKQVLSGQDKLAEFIANRWLFRNMPVYKFFETSLEKIAPEFETIKELSVEQAQELISGAVEQFGPELSFCFVVLNEVALPKKAFNGLQQSALEALAVRQERGEKSEEQSDVVRLKDEVDRLKAKHERKVLSMVKKHQQEIARLKNEIIALKRDRVNA